MEQFIVELVKNPTLGFAGVVALILLAWIFRVHQNLERRVDEAISKNEEIHRYYQEQAQSQLKEFREDLKAITDGFIASQEQTTKAVKDLAGEIKELAGEMKEIKRYIWSERVDSKE